MLTFEVLHQKLKESIPIETFNQDTLKTLNLYDNDHGYNNAAGLLADRIEILQMYFTDWDSLRFLELELQE